MMKKRLLITKDVLRYDYLRVYNPNSYFDSPNISKLASNGTLFKRFYSSAPTTNLAVLSMFSGIPVHSHNIKSIGSITEHKQSQTVFSHFEKNNVKTHTLWSKEFKKLTKGKINIFDDNTKIHFAPLYGVEISPQKFAFQGDNARGEYDVSIMDYFYDYIKELDDNSNESWFLWCHCPHVIYPGSSYGSDICHFDNFIGRLMENIDADIILSADHGHQSCEKGRIAYGYDLYEPAIRIPLITPNYFGQSTIDYPVDQSQLYNIIVDQMIDRKEFIYSDTRFYQQADRKIAIRKNNYKLIFNKEDRSEELYDLSFDKNENVNLLIENIPDYERRAFYPLNQVYFYPFWKKAERHYNLLKVERERIWRQGNRLEENIDKIKSIRRNLKKKGISWLKISARSKKNVKGRWGSNARIPTV